jgi:hypothetical protein
MSPQEKRDDDDPGESTQVAARGVEQICATAGLGAPATDLARKDMSVREYLAVLFDRGHFTDAVKFLSHALPKREAIRWACLCAREVVGAETPAPEVRALEAAERWVRVPSEEYRRAAMTAMETAGLGSPGGCAAFGAFVSGGSLAPPDVPAVPPADHLTAHAVSGAVILAAVASTPERAPEKYRRFLGLGIGVTNGTSMRGRKREGN